jgi:CelD/BcsL family acetyltransferase involved in cellulose biosynthesis
LVESSEALRALGEAWNRLWGRLERQPIFTSFDWCMNAWTRVAERRGYQPRLVCGWLGDRLVLIWPTMEDRGVLRMLSSDTLEYRDLLVEPSPHATRWIEEAWSALRKASPASAFMFQNLRESSRLRAFMSRLPEAIRVHGGHCPVVRLDRFAGWDDYARILPKSLISDQRRQWRRIRQIHPGLSFRLVDAAEEIAPVMDWIARHKLAWSESRGKKVWFAHADIRDLLEAVAASTLQDKRLLLATLSDGECTVSAGWGFVCGDDFLFHAFAYDAAYATYSPSRLFLEQLLRCCFDKGLRTLDFMPGEEAYKRVWATDVVDMKSYVGPMNHRGRLLLAVSRWGGAEPPAAAVSVYRRLPSSWRQAVHRALHPYRVVGSAMRRRGAAETGRV